MRTAIITGGAGTIGKATAEAMLADGWSCALVDMSDAVHEVAAGIGAIGHICDVTDATQRSSLIEAVPDPKALVNCAGIAPLSPILETTEDDWRRIIEINLTGAFLLSQIAAQAMTKGGGGSIVNVASVSGLRAGVGRVAYGTSKAGLIQMTKQFAVELAQKGIRCNAVAPGPVEGPMARSSHPSGQTQDYLNSIPQGRYAQPEEIATCIAFLCSDKARFITGQCLAVDGGWVGAGVGVGSLLEGDRQ